MIAIIYLWLDTSVEYEFRGAQNVQMNQEGCIDEETSFILVIVI